MPAITNKFQYNTKYGTLYIAIEADEDKLISFFLCGSELTVDEKVYMVQGKFWRSGGSFPWVWVFDPMTYNCFNCIQLEERISEQEFCKIEEITTSLLNEWSSSNPEICKLVDAIMKFNA